MQLTMKQSTLLSLRKKITADTRRQRKREHSLPDRRVESVKRWSTILRIMAVHHSAHNKTKAGNKSSFALQLIRLILIKHRSSRIIQIMQTAMLLPRITIIHAIIVVNPDTFPENVRILGRIILMHLKPLLLKCRIRTRAIFRIVRRVRLRRKLEESTILRWKLFQKENQ